ncbi:MAG: gluconate 2-dehydrogenase subunit 3 family protein [Eudoraea sp.]|nr:gluconate 2-dehydrogenase subunit 3 family protein [Eudoraea sp.]
MKRRQAIKFTTLVVGGTVVGAELFLTGCKNDAAGKLLISEQDVSILDEVGETILPETDRSPGAKAAQIGLFMKAMITDCYSEKEQQAFIKGIASLNDTSKEKYSREFVNLNSEERLSLLLQLDKEANNSSDMIPPHYFTMMKQLTILGYFTSEPGATKALRYNPIPGEFIGCIPYKRGDKAWA